MMRKMVRNFAEKECGPSAKERDDTNNFQLRYGKTGNIGLAGITFPEKYGGVGADYISYAITIELSRVDASIGTTLAAHSNLCCNAIAQFGTQAQKKNI